MKQMTADEVAHDFARVLSQVEATQEEIVVVRDNRQVARLVPEPAGQTALEVFGDLYQTLDAQAADAWTEAIRSQRLQGTISELRHAWDS